MKKAETQIASSIRAGRSLILLGTIAAMVTTVACSSKSKPVVTSSQPISASVRPAALQTVVPVSQPGLMNVAGKTSSPVKSPPSKLIAYKSRDYGVSFVYPWQYSYLSARSVANSDSSLRPRSDGYEGQFTLARIDIPKGFYPDTDFDSGYFTLSLNQDLSEEECESTLNPGRDGKVQTNTINGVDFRWIEIESGGAGVAAKTRNYVTFANGTCYEVETGVKSKNENGLAREVDPDQVLRRLDAILTTVKILPTMQKPAAPQLESSIETPAADVQK